MGESHPSFEIKRLQGSTYVFKFGLVNAQLPHVIEDFCLQQWLNALL